MKKEKKKYEKAQTIRIDPVSSKLDCVGQVVVEVNNKKWIVTFTYDLSIIGADSFSFIIIC